jgi:hypothetical protein
MREAELCAELRQAETKKVLEALLDLHAATLEVVDEIYRPEHPAAGYVDVTIMLHVFAMRHQGTRQQQLVNSLPLPRRTIRTVCDRLEGMGFLWRDAQRVYRPTTAVAERANVAWPKTIRAVGRLCDAYSGLRAARE